MTKITKHDPEFNQERLTEWDKGYNAAVEKSQVDIFYAYTKGIKHGREVEKREMREACGELDEGKILSILNEWFECVKEPCRLKDVATAIAQAYREGKLTK